MKVFKHPGCLPAAAVVALVFVAGACGSHNDAGASRSTAATAPPERPRRRRAAGHRQA
jgi:hypothetical protein